MVFIGLNCHKKKERIPVAIKEKSRIKKITNKRSGTEDKVVDEQTL